MTQRVSQLEGAADPVIVHMQAVNAIDAGVIPRGLPTFLANGGSPLLNVNASGGDVNFDLAAAADQLIRVDRLRLVMRCATAIDYTGFGDQVALGAGDGLQLQLHDGTDVLADLFAGGEILTTEDLLSFASRWELLDSGLVLVAELDVGRVRLAYSATANPILRAIVRGDLSAITELRIMALAVEESVLI
jgi:hypothetical protein